MLELYGKNCYSGGAARVVMFDISWTCEPLKVEAWVQTQHKLRDATSSKGKTQQISWLGSLCHREENLSPDPAKQPADAGTAFSYGRWIWFLLMHKKEGVPHSCSHCQANWLLVWSIPYFCGELLLQTQCFVEGRSRYDSLIISLEGGAYWSALGKEQGFIWGFWRCCQPTAWVVVCAKSQQCGILLCQAIQTYPWWGNVVASL